MAKGMTQGEMEDAAVGVPLQDEMIESALRMASNNQLILAMERRSLMASDQHEAVTNALRMATPAQLAEAARARELHVYHKGNVLDLLQALAAMDGAPGALGRAGLLAEKKSRDYNKGESRDMYFPLGLPSYAQMIHVKSQRLLKLSTGDEPENEPIKDTLLDLINYASFAADWWKRECGGKNE